MKNYNFIFLFFLTLLSCNKSKNYSLEIDTTTELRFKNETSIKLDSLTTFEAQGPAISQNQLAFINLPDFSFKLYNRKNLDYLSQIAINQSGPDAIKNPMGSLYIGDNVAIYQFYDQSLAVLNKSGAIIKTIETKSETLSRSETIPTTTSQIIADDKYVYLMAQGSHLPDKRINHSDYIIKRVNQETGRIDLFGHYPEAYENPIRGGKQSHIANTYNNKSKSLIFSFPLEHDIFELTHDGQLIRHEQNATIFQDFSGHFYPSFTKLSKSAWPEIKEKFWSNYSYWTLIYDEIHDIYLRAVNLPIPEEKYIDNNSIKESELREYQFLIYDEKFQLIGISETISNIDLTIFTGKYFLNESGIHFYSNNQNNEDLMKFNTYDLVQKN